MVIQVQQAQYKHTQDDKLIPHTHLVEQNDIY
mgnify:CR=1 FL=1